MVSRKVVKVPGRAYLRTSSEHFNENLDGTELLENGLEYPI